MAASPAIYLHIGHAKVASSTIQGFLRLNADEIRRQGFLIADLDFEFPVTGPILNDPNRVLKHWMKGPPKRRAKLGEALRRIHHTCQNGPWRGAIISSELLGRPRAAEWFREFAEGIPLRVLHYLRRQDRWMESAWKQWGVKKGASLNHYIESSIEKLHPTFLKTARSWEEVVDQLTVLPIEGVENIQEHFANWCDLDFGKLSMVEPSNRTFDWSLLDLFFKSPSLFSSPHDNELFDFLERSLPPGAPRDGHGLMTAEQADRVWSAFEAENREIRRRFFPDLPPCDWDRPPDPREYVGRFERFGSSESVYRNLAIQLAITMEIFRQVQLVAPHMENHWKEILSLHSRADHIGDSIARRFDRLRSRLEREEARREALEKRVEQLESRSLRGFLSRWLPGKPKS